MTDGETHALGGPWAVGTDDGWERFEEPGRMTSSWERRDRKGRAEKKRLICTQRVLELD